MTNTASAHRAPHPTRSAGLTLVELLVALALGALLMAGAISLFISNRESYNVTTDMSRLQETARFALETMSRDIRMAGYFGCSSNMGSVNDAIGDSAVDRGVLWDPTDAIEGYDEVEDLNNWSPSAEPLVNALDGRARVAGTDAITVRYMAPRVPDHFATATTAVSFTLGDASAFVPNAAAAVADCGTADVFTVDTVAGNVVSSADTLSRIYDADNNPIVSPLNAVRYYVATNDRGNPALYRNVIGLDGGGAFEESPQEMFEGVADLQFLYGIDTDADGTPDDYVAAGEATLDSTAEWRQVVSIQIGLLMQTMNPIGVAVTQDFPNGLLDQGLPVFADSFRRRVFTTTVAVRNL